MTIDKNRKLESGKTPWRVCRRTESHMDLAIPIRLSVLAFLTALISISGSLVREEAPSGFFCVSGKFNCFQRDSALKA